jgi:ATP-dependent helicase IRC3
MKHYPHALIIRNADWRRGEPTTGQLDFLRKYKNCEEPEFTDWMKTERLTKGKAADMITRLRHGVRGRWASKNKAKAKMEREKAKEERSRRRGQVKVGALD